MLIVLFADQGNHPLKVYAFTAIASCNFRAFQNLAMLVNLPDAGLCIFPVARLYRQIVDSHAAAGFDAESVFRHLGHAHPRQTGFQEGSGFSSLRNRLKFCT